MFKEGWMLVWVTVKSHLYKAAGVSVWHQSLLKAFTQCTQSWQKSGPVIQTNSVHPGYKCLYETDRLEFSLKFMWRNDRWVSRVFRWFLHSDTLYFFSLQTCNVFFFKILCKNVREMNIGYVMTCYQHDYTRHGVAKTAVWVCFGIKFSKYGFLICEVCLSLNNYGIVE